MVHLGRHLVTIALAHRIHEQVFLPYPLPTSAISTFACRSSLPFVFSFMICAITLVGQPPTSRLVAWVGRFIGHPRPLLCCQYGFAGMVLSIIQFAINYFSGLVPSPPIFRFNLYNSANGACLITFDIPIKAKLVLHLPPPSSPGILRTICRPRGHPRSLSICDRRYH